LRTENCQLERVNRKEFSISHLSFFSCQFGCLILFLIVCSGWVHAQEVTPPQKSDVPTSTAKKINNRPAGAQENPPEPFDGVSIEKLDEQCVTLETEAGVIEIEVLAEAAPETVRNFLNLAATGMFTTTTFSRVVKGFVIQGGNLATSQKITPALAQRSGRTIADEPNAVKHERGIVSMARPDTPNGATSSFFILVDEASQLDGKFAAFGRVKNGMETVDAINKAPVEGENPEKPVRITRVIVSVCAK
jgi:peptidyl-prolyl cis-trans isomerase B (cyclophilin B)